MSKNQRKSVSEISHLKKSSSLNTPNHPSSKGSSINVKQNPQKTHSLSKYNMELIFQANKQYLMDKIVVSQIPKPSKYYHKIPSKTPSTTYNNQFHKLNPNHMNQIRLQRKDNITNPKNNVINYESLYSQNFANYNKTSKNSALSTKKETPKHQQKKQFQPNQAPTFLQTSYSLNFVGNYNPIPAQSAKMKQIKLMGGGQFKGQTTYHGVFKSHQQKKQKPIHHSNNKIFMTIDIPKQTIYQKQFSSVKNSRKVKSKTQSKQVEQQEVEKSSRKKVNSQMLQTTKQMQKKKFKSEYERSFQTLQPANSARSKKVAIMSLQQMKNMILNIL